ncbi:hypothetical protein OS493_021168 [Desmophyllum pertusum]|uniref:Uncharacterized protein n=1 Tax=Desmophyllum pertusum TaxID=174260 RepID=A0A9X0D292_9CNID|nr:hypothetical protein OS493_021168 [Desmophyllum pertusum]
MGCQAFFLNILTLLEVCLLWGSRRRWMLNYLFSLMAPEFSPQGSSHRCTEEQVMDHFQDFLLSLEDDKVTGYAEPVAWKAEDDLNVLQQSPLMTRRWNN